MFYQHKKLLDNLTHWWIQKYITVSAQKYTKDAASIRRPGVLTTVWGNVSQNIHNIYYQWPYGKVNSGFYIFIQTWNFGLEVFTLSLWKQCKTMKWNNSDSKNQRNQMWLNCVFFFFFSQWILLFLLWVWYIRVSNLFFCIQLMLEIN